jgi:Na+/H+-dicarboxylate symporter
MLYAPVGVFALMAIAFAQFRIEAATELFKVFAAVYLAQAIICLSGVFVLWWTSHTLRGFIFAAGEALLTAFTTGSSAATIPVEIAAAEQRLAVDRELVGLILPLGLATYKPGSAAFLAGILVFAANATHQDPTLSALPWLTLLTFAASVITPPISGGTWVALGLIASITNMPMPAVAVAASIPMLGKLNTSINSMGRLVSLLVLARNGKSAGTLERL